MTTWIHLISGHVISVVKPRQRLNVLSATKNSVQAVKSMMRKMILYSALSTIQNAVVEKKPCINAMKPGNTAVARISITVMPVMKVKIHMIAFNLCNFYHDTNKDITLDDVGILFHIGYIRAAMKENMIFRYESHIDISHLTKFIEEDLKGPRLKPEYEKRWIIHKQVKNERCEEKSWLNTIKT